MGEDDGKNKREPRLAITWILTYEGIRRHEKMVKRAKKETTQPRKEEYKILLLDLRMGSDRGSLNRIKGRKNKRSAGLKRDTIDPILRKGGT